MSWERRHALLDSYGVIGYPLATAERDAILQAWLETYCANVHAKTGAWIHRGIRWHAYSYGFETALAGAAARDAYLAVRERDVLVYFEEDPAGSGPDVFVCDGLATPPLLEGSDIYIFPRSLAWTMVFTHEQDSGLGPYFTPAPRR
jgi:hypothetical protein